MGWAALMVGIALGLRQLVQQGLGIFGGAIADRFGAKPMIVTGMLMRAGGFAAMAVAHEPWVLWLSCILSGLGGTLFDPPRAALVVKLVRPHQRGRFFSLLMMQDSAGAVIGALLGSWLLQYDFRLVCSAGAALFIACAAFNAWYLPAWKLSTVKTPVREGLGRVLRDKRFRHLCPDVNRLLHAGGAGDADAADHGERHCRFAGRREVDVRHRSHHFADPALSHCPLERETLPP